MEILGETEAIRKLRERILRVAENDYPVLLIGETGTGKELAAREIHTHSRRSSGPFLSVNCSCIPETLAEAELFGCSSSAFTGAADRPGLFEGAAGGTLFLDEIETLPLPVQERLLRVVETGQYRRLGDLRLRCADVRILAATNVSPRELVSRGKMRKDLYYRLNVLSVELPPLRDRLDDIPLLVEHFVKKTSQETGLPPRCPSNGALLILMRHSWPGNVRELENVIRRAMVMGTGAFIESRDIEFPEGPGPDVATPQDHARSFVMAREGKLSYADMARSLGVSRKTLWTWRRKWACGLESSPPAREA